MHRNRSPIRFWPLSLAALAVLGSAQAQQTADPAKLPEITVTAERWTENLREVPSSVTSLTPEVVDILNAGGKALIDGNPLPQAPKITSNVTLKYTVPVGNGDLYAFTDRAYRSKVNFFLYESTEFTDITNQIRVVGGNGFINEPHSLGVSFKAMF